MSHEDTNIPAPISKKLYITYLDLSTIALGLLVLSPKESVMLPQRSEKAGMAAPVTAAAMVPIIIRMMSVRSANLNREQNPTGSSSFFRVGSNSSSYCFLDLTGESELGNICNSDASLIKNY